MSRSTHGGPMRGHQRAGHQRFAAVAALTAFTALTAAQTSSQDYPQWRGRNRDGEAAGFVQPRTWPNALNLKWKVDVGPGYATPIVVGTRIYAFTRHDENEVLTALDCETGKVMWKTSYPAPHKVVAAAEGHGPGPKSTPLFYNGKLYTLGISGIVSSFDASTGKLLWQKGAPPVEPLYGNAAMSPLGEKDVVIFHVGGHNQGALTAFEANTGAVKWSWSGDGPAYASPVVADFQGTRQVVAMTQQNVVGLSAATGQLLWQRPFASPFTNNAITPILYGDTIIVSGYEKGVAAFKPVKQGDRWGTESVWQMQEISMFMSNPVVIGETLYGLSQLKSGQFFALDVKTGKTLWLGEAREATNVAITKAGDLLFLLNDSGELIVARSSRTKFEPLKRYTVADSATWAQPTISGNRVFVKDASSLALWTVN
jgi:outer membrane protein assembly factor BamB